VKFSLFYFLSWPGDLVLQIRNYSLSVVWPGYPISLTNSVSRFSGCENIDVDMLSQGLCMLYLPFSKFIQLCYSVLVLRFIR
jgi:hypothetical protein